MKKHILIMKFGGSVLKSIDDFSKISDIAIKKLKKYNKLIIVVSALSGMTDLLFKLSKELHPTPPLREQDMLVSVGERISISLLAISLDKKKQKAISFTGSQSGIITCNNHNNALIKDVKPIRLLENLKKNKIIIVAGFQGVSKKKEITTLGRGGSDTTAIAIAASLRAPIVEFYKDVKGIFNKNPNENKDAIAYQNLSYTKALNLMKCIKESAPLHERAIKLAKKNKIQLHIKTLHSDSIETMIGQFSLDKKKEIIYE